jgi:rhomboid protease GluP
VYGVFFALLTSNLIPKKLRQPLLQSIAIFIGYNLLYGLKGGIDNAAHVGGLLSGLVFGYGYVLSIRKEKTGLTLKWVVPAVIVFTAAVSFYYLRQNKMPVSGRTAILNEIKNGSYKDDEKFNDKLTEFNKIHAETDAALGDTTLSYEQIAVVIDKTAIPNFETAAQMISSTKSYDISPVSHEKARLLLEYLSMKKEEMVIMKKICLGGEAEQLMPQLEDVRSKAGDIYNRVLKL